VDPFPFVPADETHRMERATEILNIQVQGLAGRFRATGSHHAVIGISGGLDSTLALLVAVEAFRKLGRALADVHCVTMPGFGTTSRTYNNASRLVNELGATLFEVNIAKAVNQHLLDIWQPVDPKGEYVQDITYENAQARERTQILMDYANKVGGLVVGTGDLSELALGWCTYNGDQMSMYGVNASIPKTLVRYIIEAYAVSEDTPEQIRNILLDVADTPISPELLPPNEQGEIVQKTEEAIGKYDLNDFFLYNLLRCKFTLRKIYLLALQAFPQAGEEQVLASLERFYTRFHTQQFKRSAMPDGVKVGSVNLSPRGDWRAPSDVPHATIMQHIADVRAFAEQLTAGRRQ
jgi:NAD+ synthase (glutamine-hydrolysing)